MDTEMNNFYLFPLVAHSIPLNYSHNLLKPLLIYIIISPHNLFVIHIFLWSAHDHTSMGVSLTVFVWECPNHISMGLAQPYFYSSVIFLWKCSNHISMGVPITRFLWECPFNYFYESVTDHISMGVLQPYFYAVPPFNHNLYGSAPDHISIKLACPSPSSRRLTCTIDYMTLCRKAINLSRWSFYSFYLSSL